MGQDVDAEALRNRRLVARQLLDAGVAQAEVACRLGVSRQSVSRWAAEPVERLGVIQRFGRKSTINDQLLAQLRQEMVSDAIRQGIPAATWTLPQVRERIIKLGGPAFSLVHVWRLLGRIGLNKQGWMPRTRGRDGAVITAGTHPQIPEIKKKFGEGVKPSPTLTRSA
jgi:putative transposase